MKRHTTVVWESIVNISYNLLNTYNYQALYKNITATPSQLYEVGIFSNEETSKCQEKV